MFFLNIFENEKWNIVVLLFWFWGIFIKNEISKFVIINSVKVVKNIEKFMIFIKFSLRKGLIVMVRFIDIVKYLSFLLWCLVGMMFVVIVFVIVVKMLN